MLSLWTILSHWHYYLSDLKFVNPSIEHRKLMLWCAYSLKKFFQSPQFRRSLRSYLSRKGMNLLLFLNLFNSIVVTQCHSGSNHEIKTACFIYLLVFSLKLKLYAVFIYILSSWFWIQLNYNNWNRWEWIKLLV